MNGLMEVSLSESVKHLSARDIGAISALDEGEHVAKWIPARCVFSVDSLSMAQLVLLYNFTKAAGIRRCIKVVVARAKETADRPSVKKATKVSIIRQMFLEGQSWTDKELMTRTGFDRRTVMSVMWVLAQPKRTKFPLITTYDRATKSFSLPAVSTVKLANGCTD